MSDYFKQRQQSGFTLIELMVTLVLLAILASSAAPMLQLTAKRSKEQELRRALWQIRDAIDAYKQAADDGLIEISKDKTGYPANLTILVTGVENRQYPKHKKIIFLRQIPRDPFNTDSTLSALETWQQRSYLNAIDDKDSSDDVYDVHSMSHEIGLNNIEYTLW